MNSDKALKIVFIAPLRIRPKETVMAKMVPLAAELQQGGATVKLLQNPSMNIQMNASGKDASAGKIYNHYYLRQFNNF